MKDNHGYIYVLINPSMPNMVKIGMTTRTPEERAQELYQATGVATPFIVAFKVYLNDCYRCEQYIHKYLEEKGYRVNPNREFFQMSPTDAINTVMKFTAENKVAADYPTSTSTSINNNNCSLDIEYDGDCHSTGKNNYIKDDELSIRCYNKAIKLGSKTAYSKLGNIYLAKNNKKKALSTFTNGINAGDINSYIGLGDYYYAYFRSSGSCDSINNYMKCYCSFFDYYLGNNTRTELMKIHFINYIKGIINLNKNYQKDVNIPSKYIFELKKYKNDIIFSCRDILYNNYFFKNIINYSEELNKYLTIIIENVNKTNISFFQYLKSVNDKIEEVKTQKRLILELTKKELHRRREYEKAEFIKKQYAELITWSKKTLAKYYYNNYYVNFTDEDIIEHAYLIRILSNIDNKPKSLSSVDVDDIKRFIESALLGNDKDLFLVGQYYLRGLSPFPKNIKRAKYWYNKAASQGNKDALWIINHSL